MANTAAAMLTDINTILLDTNLCIDNFNKALASLSEACIQFVNEYDNYVYETFYDATYLKNRIKDTVMKAVTNELR